MDTFLKIHKEFRNSFLKENLQHASSGAFQQIEINGFYLKLSFQISEGS